MAKKLSTKQKQYRTQYSKERSRIIRQIKSWEKQGFFVHDIPIPKTIRELQNSGKNITKKDVDSLKRKTTSNLSKRLRYYDVNKGVEFKGEKAVNVRNYRQQEEIKTLRNIAKYQGRKYGGYYQEKERIREKWEREFLFEEIDSRLAQPETEEVTTPEPVSYDIYSQEEIEQLIANQREDRQEQTQEKTDFLYQTYNGKTYQIDPNTGEVISETWADKAIDYFSGVMSMLPESPVKDWWTNLEEFLRSDQKYANVFAKAINRMQSEGLTPHKAVHYIGSAENFIENLYDYLYDDIPDMPPYELIFEDY